VPVLIGTCGWQYRHWRGGLYPPALPSARWLGHYAERFATVEIDSAFYRLPERSAFEHWAEAVPPGFVFATKASRYLTHIRRLTDPAEPVARLLKRSEGLGPALGPVLLQLPPTLRADADRLDATLASFPPHVRVAVEPRHDSWWQPEVRAVLERRGAALCLADRDGHGPPHWRTADWGYVRFHHGRGRPDGCYGREALAGWAQALARLWPAGADVYAYFNNDTNGCAPRDAHRFALEAARAGLDPTRTPAPSETPVSG